MASTTRSGGPPRGVWRPTPKSRLAGPALIDTHIWLWYLDGVEDAMSTDAVRLLRHTARTTGLLVSDISVWEIGTKATKGKLALAPSVGAWLARAEGQPGLAFQPLDRVALLASTQLPEPIHRDPVDRMLIAHAAAAGIPLVTADASIMVHAEHTKAVSVCDARP